MNWLGWSTYKKVLISMQLGLILIFVATLLTGVETTVVGLAGIGLVIASVKLMEVK